MNQQPPLSSPLNESIIKTKEDYELEQKYKMELLRTINLEIGDITKKINKLEVENQLQLSYQEQWRIIRSNLIEYIRSKIAPVYLPDVSPEEISLEHFVLKLRKFVTPDGYMGHWELLPPHSKGGGRHRVCIPVDTLRYLPAVCPTNHAFITYLANNTLIEQEIVLV